MKNQISSSGPGKRLFPGVRGHYPSRFDAVEASERLDRLAGLMERPDNFAENPRALDARRTELDLGVDQDAGPRTPHAGAAVGIECQTVVHRTQIGAEEVHRDLTLDMGGRDEEAAEFHEDLRAA